MNTFSKIILSLILILALWWCYDTFFAGNIPEIGLIKEKKEQPVETQVKDSAEDKLPEKETVTPEEKESDKVYLWFLSSDKQGNQFLKPVSRPLPPGKDKILYSFDCLFEGPNGIEKSLGVYSEIPDSVKLLGVTVGKDKVLINISSDFEKGGGSDSLYSRMRQVIKTAGSNSDRPVFLLIDGKKVDVIGGEGITFTQPLSEKSLDE